jgi:hypothetical protein
MRSVKRVLVTAILLAAPAASTFAADDERWGPYVGTVAGQPAVAELEMTEKGILTARFFYRRFGRDIDLSPSSDGKTLTECGSMEGDYSRGVEPCESPTGTWKVEVTRDAIRGKWHSPNGKGTPRPISLTRATDVSEGSYERLRHADDRIRVVTTKSSGPVAWKIVREERSQAETPLLTKAPDAAAMNRINDSLEKGFRDEISSRLANETRKSSVTVVFANERLFAGRIEYGEWGGAHPTNAFGAFTLDLRTGEAVVWSDVLLFLDSDAAPDAAIDLQREDILAADVLREEVRLSQTDDGWCEKLVGEYYRCEKGRCSMDPQRVSPTNWMVYPTEGGLAVAADVYDEASRGCRGETVVVPWAAVRKTLRRATTIP